MKKPCRFCGAICSFLKVTLSCKTDNFIRIVAGWSKNHNQTLIPWIKAWFYASKFLNNETVSHCHPKKTEHEMIFKVSQAIIACKGWTWRSCMCPVRRTKPSVRLQVSTMYMVEAIWADQRDLGKPEVFPNWTALEGDEGNCENGSALYMAESI